MDLIKPIWESDHPDHIKLRVIWGMLAGCQGAVISQLLKSRIGNKVFAGPFRGLELTEEMMKWHFSPTLLGTYEWELHHMIEKIIATSPRKILNVGCAHGYYSVGFAMRLPQATIYAYDTDPEMRKHCQELAELNNVAERIVIDEQMTQEEFAKFSPDETFLLVDIEGAEVQLLDPIAAPALQKMNMIVELHDAIIEGESAIMTERFQNTHDVQIIPNAPFNFPLDKILGSDYVQDHFDNLIATWESRGGPTPYGVFMRKS